MSGINSAQPLKLRFLGACEVSRPDGVVHLETVKTYGLLTYLALSRGPQSRDKLAGLFWGDLPQARAQRNLRHSLWNLLHQLRIPEHPPLILSDKHIVEFNPQADYWLDVEEFESRLGLGSQDSFKSKAAQAHGRRRTATIPQAVSLPIPHVMWREAMDLYGGDLLEGLYVDDAPEFGEWLLAERERLKAMAVRTLQRLVSYFVVSADYGPGLETARRLLAMDPWVEEAHRHMMRLLALNGQRTAALAQYETCRRILKKELGIEPSAETTSLYRRLSESPSLPAEIVLGRIPIPITRLVGRDEDTAAVRSLLAHSRLVTLTGAGGCGKTRLAIQVATSLLDAFMDGILWIDIAPLGDAGLVAQSIAQALGILASPNRPLIDTFSAHLRGREMLIVLDNCEHLVQECARLAFGLLGTCSRIRILATSRQPLDIVGEVAWRVPSLALPVTGSWASAQDLRRYTACELFVERAQAVRTDFALTDENAAHVAQVCKRLDGIPLAIELAAARVNVLPVKEIAERLSDRFDLLTRRADSALPRHQTLRGMIDWSYDILDDSERSLFRRLAVFVGGWTLAAAEHVARAEMQSASSGAPHSQASGLPALGILPLLSRLIDKSLVATLTKGEQTRYQFAETIREYARQKLVESGESDRMRDAHLSYFLGLAEEGEPSLYNAEQVFWLNRLELEHDNFRAALGWALECDKAEAGLRLASALGEFWERHGYLVEGSEWFRKAIAKFTRGSVEMRARAIVRAAKLEWTHGGYDRALALAQDSLTLYRALGDDLGMAFSLYTLGGVHHYAGDHDHAISLLESSLRLFRQTRNAWGTAATLLWLACARMKQGDTEGAAPLWDESLSLFKDLGDQWGTAFALGGLGDTARMRGEYARAHRLLVDSLVLHWRQGNTSSITFVLESLATAADAEGQPERAARLWGGAGALHKSIGTPVPPAYSAEYARYLAHADGQDGASTLAAAYADGQAMTLKQMIEYASGNRPNFI